MDKKVNWGILSTAQINHRLIPAIKASERAVLRAVASRNADKARSYAEEWGIPVSYGSYQALLADPDIDAIYISLPNHLHAPYSVLALQAGKHVLCEKPLCLTLHQHDALKVASKSSGKSVAEAFMYLHHPQMAYYKSIIDSGKYGKVTALASSFCFQFGRGAENYRLAEAAGGGALWDVGVYPISLFQYLMGSRPLGVNGREKKAGVVDMSFWGTLEYPNNVTGEFFSSFEAEFTTETSVIMEGGRLNISHPFINPQACVAEIHAEGQIERLDVPQASLYAGEVENINDIVLQGVRPTVSLSQSRGHLETVLALRQSAESGKPVVLD